ncbi:MAG: hypothetical protein IPL95_16630 [Saprospiraceae bacterium]|nr:hypothetical protein [Saprospiraceae bacterium]
MLNIEAQFGVYGEPRPADIFAFTNDYFAYFRLAGTLMFNPGLPLGVPPYQLPFDLYGFGGGIHYNMLPTISEPINGSIGDGATYKPQFGSFGFQASVILGSKADPTPMNGKVTFGATMSMNRGLEQLSVIGELYLMTILIIGQNQRLKLLLILD